MNQIADQLEQIASADDFAFESEALVEQWTSMDIGVEAVEPILQFIEKYPSIDYGAPGALAHFVETFYKRGYEEKLLESICRRPTQHTIWMLNRLINGTKDPVEKQRYVTVMAQAKSNPTADQLTVDSINEFLTRLKWVSTDQVREH
jgi:hypothetical protein